MKRHSMKAEASAGDQPRSAPFDIFSPSTVLTVALEVCFVVLLLRILVALYRLNKAVKLPGQAAGRSPPSAAQQPLPKTHGSAPPHALRSSPASTSSAPPKSVGCVAGLAAAEFGDLSVPHAWSPVDHRDIKLRVGPNYKKNKKKAPSGPALLQCVGVDLIIAPRKVFSDGACDAACLPPEIAAAAAEQTPPPGSGGPLPRFLVVTISMPKYSSGATDGPNMRWAVFHGVHPSLRDDTSPPARLLCEFLDGAVTGHADKQSKFYDRFKVMVRARALDSNPGPFLQGMINWFNGTPMLWRFFGTWGRCERRGAAVFLNLDFCTGGMLKNSAFAQGVRAGFELCTFDLSWTVEARDDEEMPECLIGGATVCRPKFSVVPTMEKGSDGAYRLGDSESPGGGGGAAASQQVPRVLLTFIAARYDGDCEAAAACCTDNIECTGPLGTTRGRTEVQSKLFFRPWGNADAKVLTPLKRAAGADEVWSREVEVQHGMGLMHTVIQQRFTLVADATTKDALRVAKVEVSLKD